MSEKPIMENSYNSYDVHYSAAIELDRDIKFHKRSIYTALDLLGDVGGLFDALKGISAFIVALYFKFTGNPMHEYLLEALYLRDEES